MKTAYEIAKVKAFKKHAATLEENVIARFLSYGAERVTCPGIGDCMPYSLDLSGYWKRPKHRIWKKVSAIWTKELAENPA